MWSTNFNITLPVPVPMSKVVLLMDLDSNVFPGDPAPLLDYYLTFTDENSASYTGYGTVPMIWRSDLTAVTVPVGAVPLKQIQVDLENLDFWGYGTVNEVGYQACPGQ
jgi:hypothetical protein